MNFSNASDDVAKRLLDLYPLELVKKEYQVNGALEHVYDEIVKNNSFDDIKENALRLFGVCRQHIYLFRHNYKPAKHDGEFIAKPVTKNVTKVDGSVIAAEYLVQQNYKFLEVNNRTADERSLLHLWPVKVILTPSVLQIRLVIMEKNMRSTGNALFRGRDTEDDDIVNHVLSTFVEMQGDAQRLDFDKGIKKLWETDVVDAPRVGHKSSKSMENSLMDSGFTFKQQYPERYKEVIKNPLRKTVFFVLNDDSLPISFLADPSDGYLAFHRYQDSEVAIDNLVDSILAKN